MEYNNNNFYKEINGKQASDYVLKLDYSLKTTEERIEYVKNKLGITEENGVQFTDDFWENVFTQTVDSVCDPDKMYYIEELNNFVDINELKKWCKKNNIDINKYLNIKDKFKEAGGNGKWIYSNQKTSHIKLLLNKDDSLYSTSNIAKTLERLANYILCFDLEKKKEKPKEKIKIYENEREFKYAIEKQEKAIKKHGDVIETDEGGEMVILIPKGNFKLKPKYDVKRSDIKKYEYLKDYDDYKNYLNNLLHSRDDKKEILKKLESCDFKPNDKTKLKSIKSQIDLWWYLINSIGEVKNDMIDVKYSKEKPIEWKQALKDQGCVDWDEFDELDKTHVKALLQLHRDMETVDFQSDLMCMLYDLQKILEEIILTENQKEILELWIKGYSIEDIADKLKKSYHSINQSLDRIVNRIVNVYEEKMEDWYYLNICKGKYKKCTDCGEIKLISKFNKAKTGLYGVAGYCKNCENKRKKKSK